MPAVNSPLPSMVPPPLTPHVKAGCGMSAAPYWSLAVAVNCCVPFAETLADAGETLMLVSIGGAVTVTLAVPLMLPLAAVMV